MAHNKFVDFYRRNTRRPSIPLEDVQYELYDEDIRAPEIVALDHEEHALLRNHLASLPQIQQEVLRLLSGSCTEYRLAATMGTCW